MELIETIAIQDGEIQNRIYHQQRYQQAMRYLTQSSQNFALPTIEIPQEFKTGLVRCRLNYYQDDYAYEFFPYQAREIKSYQCVVDDNIDYTYKYANRQPLEHLLAQKGECDDIIIIKQAKVTDCSIGNLLFLKQGQWFSPKTPLLAGIQRAKLLAEQKIQLLDIEYHHLAQFERIMMINALNPFDEQRSIEISPQSIRGIS